MRNALTRRSILGVVVLAIMAATAAAATIPDDFTGNWFINGKQDNHRIGIFSDGFWYMRNPADDGFGMVSCEGYAVPDNKGQRLVLYGVFGDAPEDTQKVGSLTPDGKLRLTEDGSCLIDGELSYRVARMSAPNGELAYDEFKPFVGKWYINGKLEMESLTIHRAGTWETRTSTAEDEFGMVTCMGYFVREGDGLALYEASEKEKVGSIKFDDNGRIAMTLTEDFNFLLDNYDQKNLRFYPEGKSK